jgi:hypothetical protein
MVFKPYKKLPKERYNSKKQFHISIIQVLRDLVGPQ